MAYKEGQLFFCVDEETELLTADGWKRHEELSVGKDILTLNTETGLSEWTALGAVNRFDRDGEMIRMEGLMHSSLTTPNHRWWVNTPRGAEWATSETLVAGMTIPSEDGASFSVSELSVTREHYKGTVWCPTTPNGTFLARRNGSVYWTGNSMEAVPNQITCRGKGGFEGCGETYDYDGRQSPTYCDHLNEVASRKTLHKPRFTGGALILPPVRPGWKHADITELSHLIESNLDDAEKVYEEISHVAPHLDPVSWERIMAFMLASAQ